MKFLDFFIPKKGSPNAFGESSYTSGDVIFQNVGKMLLDILLIILSIRTILGSFVIVPTSYVGIKRTMNIIHSKPLLEGVHFKVPFIQSVEEQSIKTIQEEHELTRIQAKDMQEISIYYKVAYRIPFDKVIPNAQTLQGDVYEVIIEPRVKETMADIVVRYTAEEVISKREEIAKIAREQIMKNDEISKRSIIEEVVLMKFDFTDPAFKKAVDDKKRAIQYAEQAEVEKKTAKARADQAIFEAEGKAKAIKLEAEAMKANQKIVEMKQIDASIKAIEKWDGRLPNVLINGGKSNGIPSIINIPDKIVQE